MATAVATDSSPRNPIRWGRVIGFAFALEVVLFATLLPLQSVLSLHVWFVAIAIGCCVFAYAAGRLAARGLTSGAFLHGLLVGIIATGIYLAINVFAPGGLGALRIAGCAAGALHQKRKGRP